MTKTFKIALVALSALAVVACPPPESPSPKAVLFGGDVMIMGAIDEDGDQMPDNGEWGFFLTPNLSMAGDAVVDFNFPADFFQYTNCGVVEISLSGAGAQAGKTVYCDAAGSNSVASAGRGSGVISAGGNALVMLQNMGVDWQYNGGRQMPISIYIDVNGNAVCDDGDYFYDAGNITVNGNMTVPVVFGDFSVVANSGTLWFEITGADVEHSGERFIGGTRYPPTTFNENEDIIHTSPQDFLCMKNDSAFVFRGGMTVMAGGMIDVDGDGIDDGDWLTGVSIPINGTTLVTSTYPTDFTRISGMGTITVNINGANAAHAGEPLIIQAVSTQGGSICSRFTTVSGNAVSVTFNINDIVQQE